MRFFLSCLPHPHLITEDSTKQDRNDIQLALFSLKMVCAFLIMTQCSQRKPHLETTEGWKMPFFVIFCLIFLAKSSDVVTMVTSIEHDDLYINYLLSHQKSEENLRPCVNSLHYRMLHDYRELILSYQVCICFRFPFKSMQIVFQ